jgi:cytochrome oxidase Cu insertion factor (SCO1/SenC/PrrC family)
VSIDLSKVKNNSRVPALILGSLVLVIFISTLLFRASVTGSINLPELLGTKNNGTLITPPQPLADLPLQIAGADRFQFDALPKQWSLLIPVARHCDEQCKQTLYTTRQLHIALGKNTERVRRFFVVTDYPLDADFEKLLSEHPRVQVLTADAAAFKQFFAKAGLEPLRDRQYFIVDPNGWVMMYYNDQHNGKAVMADLKFLLTNSHENEDRG